MRGGSSISLVTRDGSHEIIRPTPLMSDSLVLLQQARQDEGEAQ